jgi:hypothetical protein
MRYDHCMGLVLQTDIERVRLSAENTALSALERLERHSLRWEYREPAQARRDVMARALLLTESMAPGAHAALREAVSALGVADEVELFQQSDKERDNARLVLYGQPLGIEFLGRYLEMLDHGTLVAVIGHEIGHAYAHNAHPVHRRAQSVRCTPTTSARRAYSVAAELTADRCGLLACRDVDAALRLEMLSAAGGAMTSIQLDTHAYLKQCRALAEDLLARGATMHGSTHPEHLIRGYAVWLFSETDLYRELVGKGSAAHTIAEADALLAKLVAMPTVGPGAGACTSAEATSKPSPRPSGGRAGASQAPLIAEPTLVRAQGAAASAGATLSSLMRDGLPAVQRFASAARAHLGGQKEPPPPMPLDVDPLEEDRLALEARFEELERRFRDE